MIRLSSLLLLSAYLSLPLMANPLQIDPAEDLYNTAQLALQQAQSQTEEKGRKAEFQNATTWYQRYLSAYPDGSYATEAHYYLAVCLAQTGAQTEALAAYQTCLDRNPEGRMAGLSALQIALAAYQAKDSTAPSRC